MTWVERVRNVRAAWLGRYPISSIVPRTRRSVSGRSLWGALAALDTVWRDTPARSATISMVGRFFTALASFRQALQSPHLLVFPSPHCLVARLLPTPCCAKLIVQTRVTSKI